MSPWYTFGTLGGDAYLAIYGYYNGNPSLYAIFDQTYDELWARTTLRNDVWTAHDSARFLVLAFSEFITDYAYWGPSWGYAAGIGVSAPGSSYVGFVYNTNWSTSGQTAYGGNSIGSVPIVDLHAHQTGTTGGSPNKGSWDIDVYEDGVLRYTASYLAWNNDTHPMGLSGMQGIVIPHHYGDWLNTEYMAFDDISVGTTQGGTDVMDTSTFNDGTFGLLNNIEDTPGPTATFQINTV